MKKYLSFFLAVSILAFLPALALADDQSVLNALERVKGYAQAGSTIHQYRQAIADAQVELNILKRTEHGKFIDYAETCLNAFKKAERGMEAYSVHRAQGQSGLASSDMNALKDVFRQANEALDAAYKVSQ